MWFIIIKMAKALYEAGSVVYGEITGIKPYGAFVSLDDGYTGLIHISELSDGFVRDVSNFVHVGDHYMLKVIDVDHKNKQLRLSYKAYIGNTRKKYRKIKFLGIPNNEIGFSSISDALGTWIKEREK